MNQIHKTDDYNFAQPSRTGRAGFESFKNDEDGRFYFHFNDAKGVPFLFSQAYQRESTRDKGVLSVIKNAAIEAHFERLEVKPKGKNTEGGFYFSLRAGNRQEIARSRVFPSLVELVQKQTYLSKNLLLKADEPISSNAANRSVENKETETVIPTSGVSPALLKAENADLKEKVAVLERQLSGLQSISLEGKDIADETLRHVFRVEFYKNNTPERLHGHIIHPFSEQTQTFTGFDSETISAFMLDKVKADLPKTDTAGTQKVEAHPPQYKADEKQTKGKETDANRPKPSLERSPVKAVNLRNDSKILQQNNPFALIISALPNEKEGVKEGQACVVEIQAFNLDARERFKLLEKRTTVLSDDHDSNLLVRIEPLVLNTGNYRLSIAVRVLSSSKSNESVQNWSGSIIVQIL